MKNAPMCEPAKNADDDGDQDGDRRPHAEVAERQQHGEHAGHEPADVRDVVADEDRSAAMSGQAVSPTVAAVAPTMTASIAPIAGEARDVASGGVHEAAR